MSSRGMGTAAVVVSVGILGSRLLGLLRDTLLAGLLGVTFEGDVYQAAFLLPDLLNYLLAGGYLTITFIPILSAYLARGDGEGGRQAFTAIARWVGTATLALTAVLMLAAPRLTELIYPRFDLSATETVAGLTRIVLPAQVFFVLGSLLMAYQYAHGRFAVPALAPVVYNLGIIGGGLISWAMGRPSPAAFAWGALAGAALGNFGLQWWGAQSAGLRLAGSGWRHEAVGQYLALALPLMVGQSIAVLDEQFTRLFGQLASEGGIAALGLARRLNMLPVGVVAQAAGVAAFPFLARLAADGDARRLADTTVRAVRHSIFFGCGAAAGLVAVAPPAVRVVYQHGVFGPGDTVLVASLLTIYAVSVPAWAVHQVIARAFYARRMMWAPVGVGTAMTLVAAAIALPLFSALGVHGLAWMSSIAMTGYAAALAGIWGSRHGAGLLRGPAAVLGRGVVAGVIAAGVGRLTASTTEGATFWSSAVSTLVAGVVAAGLYVFVSWALRSPELSSMLRRRST